MESSRETLPRGLFRKTRSATPSWQFKNGLQHLLWLSADGRPARLRRDGNRRLACFELDRPAADDAGPARLSALARRRTEYELGGDDGDGPAPREERTKSQTKLPTYFRSASGN